ncbi:unnamed protein product, partial [Rotaria sp. Silwood1]
FYFLDSSIRPVSPELLCVHGKYLYVSVRASESLGVVVFNEECEIVDWFRNSTLKEVLAMDIDVDINELYILTTTQDKNDERKKRPLIVSMDIVRIYIATKYEITIVSLDEKGEIKARYGAEGNGPCKFKHISYLYIPSNDETNLYIVDCGQQCVHQYQIDNTGHRFDYVHQYFVIANVREPYNLVSCVIFNENLYVSDNANHCLHIFPLKADRQSDYLVDKSIIRFSPGSLCVHEKYLFVADCSVQSPGILVFNEQRQIINWFRHSMLKEILAMDIDPKVNDLYILTSTKHENDEKRKGLLIVPIDLVVRPQK